MNANRRSQTLYPILCVLAIISANSFGEAKKTVCLKEGETLVLNKQTPPEPWALAICERAPNTSGKLRARFISKSEVNRLYVSTRNNPDHVKKWARYLGVEEKEATILEAIIEIPTHDLVEWQDRDKAVISEIGALYQEHISKIGGRPRELNPKDSRSAQAEYYDAARTFADCLVSNGSLVMSEAADKSGCYCGSQKYNNYVEFQCKGRQLVPTTAASSGAQSNVAGASQ